MPASPSGPLIVIISAVAGTWPEQELWRQPRVKRVWRPSRRALLLSLAGFLVLLAGVAIGWHYYRLHQLEQQALDGGRGVDLAIARWSVDQFAPDGEHLPFDSFPQRAEMALDESMPQFATNVYATPARPVRNVSPDSPAPGDFSYVPRRLLMRLEDGSELQAWGAYVVLVWGRRRRAEAVEGVDSVILKQRTDLPLIYVGEGVQFKRSALPDHYLGLKVDLIEIESIDEALLAAGLSAVNQ